MGGPGSGNYFPWWRSSRKETVEDCKTLDLVYLARLGALVAVDQGGVLRWRRGDQEAGSAGFWVRALGTDLVLVLAYRATPPGGDGEDVIVPVRLESTRLGRGGRRWWARCPLIVDGHACNRRVGKLYLPPGAHYFGCRHCHDLTYTSCQESHKYDAMYRDLARHLGRDFETMKWGLALGERDREQRRQRCQTLH